MSKSVKLAFGKRFREARDGKKLSRAALGQRLGISPKTIQSWEMGRTFIEDLSLIPAIEVELEISVSDLIAEATGTGACNGTEDTARPVDGGSHVLAGPAKPSLQVHVQALTNMPDHEELIKDVVAVPMIRSRAEHKPVSELTPDDIHQYVVIPGSWVPRGGVLVAYRMGDSGMLPMMPLGATVIVDRRAMDLEKSIDQVAALFFESKGVRIRKLVRDRKSGRFLAQTIIEGRRTSLPFRPDQGDSILGRVVGVLAQPE